MREMTAAASLGKEPPHVPWTSSGAERRLPSARGTAAWLIGCERARPDTSETSAPQRLINIRRVMQADHSISLHRKYGQALPFRTGMGLTINSFHQESLNFTTSSYTRRCSFGDVSEFFVQRSTSTHLEGC